MFVKILELWKVRGEYSSLIATNQIKLRYNQWKYGRIKDNRHVELSGLLRATPVEDD